MVQYSPFVQREYKMRRDIFPLFRGRIFLLADILLLIKGSIMKGK